MSCETGNRLSFLRLPATLPALALLAATGCVTAFAQIDTTQYYYLSNQFQGDNQVLQASGVSNGAVSMSLQAKSNIYAQYWTLIPWPDGSYKLSAGTLGRGWSIDGSTPVTAPVPMTISDYYSASQRWNVTTWSNGSCLRLQNLSTGAAESLDSSPAGPVMGPTGPFTGQCWKLTPIGPYPQPLLNTTYVRLKNNNGQYMHMEAQDGSMNGTLQAGAIQSGWWSAMWVFEPAGANEPLYRIKNRWTGKYLHMEAADGSTNGTLTAGDIQPGWWSALWAIKPTNASDPVNNPVFWLENRWTNKTIDIVSGQPSAEIAQLVPNQLYFWTFEAVPDPTQSLTLPTGTVSAASTTGASFTVNSTYGPNDTLSVTVNGSVDLASGAESTNAAGIVVAPQSGGLAPLGRCPKVPNSVVPGACVGALLIGNSTLGWFPLFPANADNGLGSANAPQTLTLTNVPLSTIFGSNVSIPNGSTLILKVNDSLYSDNSASFGVGTQPPPSIISVKPGAITANSSTTLTIVGNNFDTTTAQISLNCSGCVLYNPGPVTRTTNTLVTGNILWQSVQTYQVTVSNGPSGTQSNALTFAVTQGAPPALTLVCSPTTGPTTVGVSWTTTCTASGGVPPYSFGLNPPNVIPSGLSGTQTGANTDVTSGTPTQAGPYSFGKFVQDSANPKNTITVTFTGTISAPGCSTPVTISPFAPNPPNFTAAGGAGSVAISDPQNCGWTITSVPSWITFNQTTGANNINLGYTVQANAGAARSATVMIAGLPFTVFEAGTSTTTSSRFVPVSPCRIVDTRNPAGVFGGPILGANTSRTFPVTQSTCGIPSTATAYSLNFTVVPSAGLAYLSTWPTGQLKPLVSTLNSLEGRIVANAAIVPAGSNGSVDVYVTDKTHVVIDINGYFDATSPSGLPFYTVNPCRVSDTRNAFGPFGGPSLVSNDTKSVPVTQSTCGVPANAQAVSLNATVVPQGGLGYLSLWPTGQTQPLVSTLNSLDGRITANAAIVPTGGGHVSAFVTNPTDLVLDVDGYFGQSGTGTPLSFYPVTPCRIADTRNPSGTFGGPVIAGQATRSFPVTQSACNIPSAARAYSLNVTVVPRGSLPYLTIWPSDQSQPLVSTLNSPAGSIVANAAIVPASANGSVSVFVFSSSDVILDINGYFAQ